MSFSYSFKKWFKLITQPHNDYNHAIFFGSLIPSWNWKTLTPWKVEPVTLYKKFDSDYAIRQDPEVSNSSSYHTLMTRDKLGKRTYHVYYIKEV